MSHRLAEVKAVADSIAAIKRGCNRAACNALTTNLGVVVKSCFNVTIEHVNWRAILPLRASAHQQLKRRGDVVGAQARFIRVHADIVPGFRLGGSSGQNVETPHVPLAHDRK